jgi:hypothetical protein
MNADTRTKTGTVLKDGIEYKHYPPPSVLIKIMKRIHARPLLSTGRLRLANVTYYQKLENDHLGDTRDGIGMFRRKGHEYTTGTANPVFVCCMSLKTLSHKRVLEIARSEYYDCILRIHDPEAFFRRIYASLKARRGCYWLHCGRVQYNRGKEVTKRALASQQFNHNVFQKAPLFRRDQEYRLSVSNISLHPRSGQFINLVLGRCSDIMTIEDLPNNSR